MYGVVLLIKKKLGRKLKECCNGNWGIMCNCDWSSCSL